MSQDTIPTDRRPARASRALRVLFVAVALAGAGLSLGGCKCGEVNFLDPSGVECTP